MRSINTNFGVARKIWRKARSRRSRGEVSVSQILMGVEPARSAQHLFKTEFAKQVQDAVARDFAFALRRRKHLPY